MRMVGSAPNLQPSCGLLYESASLMAGWSIMTVMSRLPLKTVSANDLCGDANKGAQSVVNLASPA